MNSNLTKGEKFLHGLHLRIATATAELMEWWKLAAEAAEGLGVDQASVVLLFPF